jgi:hypothetical protein
VSAEEGVFLEKDGVVVMEAESTESRLGDWEVRTDVEGYQGEGHLEFTGNKHESGPPDSPLKYSFKVTKPGKYVLILRARKRLESKRQDISNDCYVRLEGDYESGNNTPKKVLGDDTKLFGGIADGWGQAVKLDVHHKKYDPVYVLKAGETYEFVMSGRSKNFNVDRILFVHEDEEARKVLGGDPAESERE